MITLYIGKSGAGKDTFLNKMVKCGIKPIISYTTRPMRTGEVDGKDYNFVSNEEFDKRYTRKAVCLKPEHTKRCLMVLRMFGIMEVPRLIPKMIM